MSDRLDWPSELILPPSTPVAPYAPLTAEGRAAIERFVSACNHADGHHRGTPPPQLDDRDFELLCRSVEKFDYAGGDFPTPFPPTTAFVRYWPAAVDLNGLTALQTVRLLALARQIESQSFSVAAEQQMASFALDPRAVAALLAASKIPTQAIAWSCFEGGAVPHDGSAERIWPYFLDHLDVLLAVLEGREECSYLFSRPVERKLLAIRIIGACPRVPPPVAGRLVALAVGNAKALRPPSQQALEKEPEARDWAIERLEGGRAGERAVAAEWLGRLGGPGVADALREARGREKTRTARSAIDNALDVLGEPAESLTPRRADAEAAAGLASVRDLTGIMWIPFDQMPRLCWGRSGEEVQPETVRWWLFEATRKASPEPDVALRRRFELTTRESRHAFGADLLHAWIDLDTMPLDAATARERAWREYEYLEKQAGELVGLMWATPPIEDLERKHLKQPAGSAIALKGVLAACAACGGERVAEQAIAYIRKWYGMRAAQSKALVRALSWIDVPVAVQFLTATAARFRTPGVRTQARVALESLAERKGWTTQELADAMIPDAGLNQQGRLFLDYGRRSFTVELDPGLRLQVRGEDGRPRVAPPKPAKGDDPAAAERARKSFSSAKKQIRAVEREQTARLFSAMCSERRWPAQRFQSALLDHPIMSRLCGRLVWRAEVSGRVKTFRPAGGRNLIDIEGEPVRLLDEARVFLAHDCNTPAVEAAPWLDHLASYAVPPLFPQLNRGLPELAAATLEADAINDFQGEEVAGLTLRDRARKLSYLRGEAVDGPAFYCYFKPYPDMGIEVHIEISGNEIPETNLAVTIDCLRFLPRGRSRPLALGDVPRILLLESFRELQHIASPQ